MTNLNDCYNESKNYSDIIMVEVKNVLDNAGVTYDVKSNGHEIVITANGQSEGSITTLLNNQLKISKEVISLLLEVVEVSESIYVRQKTK